MESKEEFVERLEVLVDKTNRLMNLIMKFPSDEKLQFAKLDLAAAELHDECKSALKELAD